MQANVLARMARKIDDSRFNINHEDDHVCGLRNIELAGYGL